MTAPEPTYTASDQAPTWDADEATQDAHFIVGWFLQCSSRADLARLLEVLEASERGLGASWVREALRRSHS